MQIKTFPYEFLARWKNGVFSGYHLITATHACDDNGLVLLEEDGQPMLQKIGAPQTLDAAGVDVSDLITEGLATALKAVDTYKAQVADLEEKLNAATTELTGIKKSV